MGLFSFPNPVNEVAARAVAAGVAGLCGLTLALSLAAGRGWLWLTAVIAYGFLARVLTGPTLSPLGQLATRAVAPAIGRAKPVPGPPKRFAQGIGAVMSAAAVLAHFAGGFDGVAQVLIAAILVAATLESAFAFCIGCRIFAVLMRLGIIPEQMCADCANVPAWLARLKGGTPVA